MRLLCLFLLIFLGVSSAALATHQRAGEITYTWVSGYNYHFTVTTYAYSGSLADDDEITVFFGDGDNDIAPRTNGGGNGEIIAPGIRKNIYEVSHNYYGPGNYRIHVELLNRKGMIVNIQNSAGIPLFLETWLLINPLIAPNNSVQFIYDPLDTACIGNCFNHNALAFDPDGDSLRFELINCLGANGNPIPTYTLPQTTTIDPRTGDMLWCSPYMMPSYSFPQEWNFAFKVHEFRRTTSGLWVEVGSVERDMQVTVVNCQNNPPVLSAISDLCILESTTGTTTFNATDPQGDDITLTAYGAPFSMSPPAVFSATTSSPFTGTFSWTPSCDAVRKQPYQVLIKATDNNTEVNLSDLQSFFVYVIARGPDNLQSAGQSCNDVTIQWDPSSCNPVPNPVAGYKIFMDDYCNPWMPGTCETGVPSYTGYSQVAYVNGISSTTATIQNLTPGNNYSFRVVTVFTDGAESMASDPLCIQPKKMVPLMTHADVMTTDNTSGNINVQWVLPPANANGLDTLAHPGPYKLKLLYGFGVANPAFPLDSFSAVYYTGMNLSGYVHSGINTSDNQFVYRADLYDANGKICNSISASSVYLTIAPSDNTLTLSWNFLVPWNNYLFRIWKQLPTGWTMIGTTTSLTYTDNNLVNGVSFCYYVEAVGAYSDPSVTAPLLNRSEIKCGIPKDMTPPCAPVLDLVSECENEFNNLSWNNPNLSCADDVVGYNIYYSSQLGMDPFLLSYVPLSTITTYIHDSLSSVAGCYFITAVDSFNNESAVSNRICIDNCPVYELPNVFTPNGDGTNDFFLALPFRHVKEIDLKIYNRWGEVVFESKDPGFRWDGRSTHNGSLCSDGVYYYTCSVYEIHISGLETSKIQGFVHILGAK